MQTITITTDITQGGFPFQSGRSYRVHPARGANLIAGGHAVDGAPDGVTITEAPAEDGAIYRAAPEPVAEPIAAPEQIPPAVIAPETAAATTVPADEKPPLTEIGGAEALTAPKKKGKLSGTANVAQKTS